MIEFNLMRVGGTPGDPVNNPELLQHKTHATVTAQVLDSAHTIFGSLWARLGNMQQSVSAVVTLISILTAALLAFSSLSDGSGSVLSRKTTELGFIVLPLLSLTLIYLVVTLICAGYVLWPKRAKTLVAPRALDERAWESARDSLFKHGNYFVAIGAANERLIKEIDEITQSIESVLLRNQYQYHRALKSASATGIFLASLGGTFFLNIPKPISIIVQCGVLSAIIILGLIAGIWVYHRTEFENTGD